MRPRYWPVRFPEIEYIPLLDLPQISDEKWEQMAAARKKE
jgi:hypothetical protein